MFCITLNEAHCDKIKNIGYSPVCLGTNRVSDEFFSDNTNDNIASKNPYYGEYTFHYWLWKNKLKDLKNDWIGFCQYRKFWSEDNNNINLINLGDLKKIILKNISNKYESYDSIIGKPQYVNQFKLSKFIKKGLKKMIKQPSLFFNNKKRNLKFHFDLMHGDGNLDKAINILDLNERSDFKYFVNSEVSFNPHNMFICRTPKILNDYYNSIFPWLKECEKEFGFELEGYGLKRIYGFLAERYMSFWFKKHTKHTTLPIIFKDITELN